MWHSIKGQLKGSKVTSAKIDSSIPDLSDANDGIKLPRQGTLYHVVFELRLDGKRHPKSYARLPTVTSLMNQDIANSWALRVEWQNPSGQTQSRYLQQGGRRRIGYQAPANAARGHSHAYIRGMEILHWLVGVKCADAYLRSYMNVLGNANVLQVHHDYFSQTIEFGPQKSYPHRIDYGRVNHDDIMANMRNAGLNNVNDSFDARRKKRKCDTCIRDVRENIPCTKKAGVQGEVYTHCYDVGRSACSWTGVGKGEPGWTDKVMPLLVSTRVSPLNCSARWVQT
jgi:hypothetical protein